MYFKIDENAKFNSKIKGFRSQFRGVRKIDFSYLDYLIFFLNFYPSPGFSINLLYQTLIDKFGLKKIQISDGNKCAIGKSIKSCITKF